MSARPIRVALAAGGTGGHVFPAAALSEVLRARGCELVLFTDRRGGQVPSALAELKTERLAGEPYAGRGLLGRLRAGLLLVRGVLGAMARLRRLKPDVVAGFGGYAALPAVIAAQRLGIPTVIHEQNAVLGRANRLVARRARGICTSFEIVAGLDAKLRDRTTRTGNPVRAAIAALRDQPYPTPTPGGPLSLLALGGSQGARVLGEVLPAALDLLPAALRARLVVAQQCRPETLDEVREAYRRAGIEAELAPFFRDMGERLSAAHLVIARAGASTVAELAAAGRPAVLVPYPHAADDHQTANAQALSAAGGAWLLPQQGFTAPALATRLRAILERPETLAEAAACARALGGADAAERLADVVMSLAPAANGAVARDRPLTLEAAL